MPEAGDGAREGVAVLRRLALVGRGRGRGWGRPRRSCRGQRRGAGLCHQPADAAAGRQARHAAKLLETVQQSAARPTRRREGTLYVRNGEHAAACHLEAVFGRHLGLGVCAAATEHVDGGQLQDQRAAQQRPGRRRASAAAATAARCRA